MSAASSALPPSRPRKGVLTLHARERRQDMEGIGASLSYFGDFVAKHPRRKQIYDALFRELAPSVLRLRNSFRLPNGDEAMKVDTEVVANARARAKAMGREVKLILTAWSPPAELKASGSCKGGSKDAVLRKNKRSGEFAYDAFAEWWLESLTAYRGVGIEPSWLSIQNEPDFNTKAHDACIFGAAETYHTPSYWRAFDRVYETLHRRMPSGKVPRMIGPESTGFDQLLEHPYVSSPRVDAVANHLYHAGERFGDESFFPRLRTSLRTGSAAVSRAGGGKVFCTEWANLAPHELQDPLLLAKTIFYTLVEGRASMYLCFDLAWPRGHSEGSLLLVDDPNRGREAPWATENGFERTQSFHWFRIFSLFILPGMTLCATSIGGGDAAGILPLFFTGRAGECTIILINEGMSPIDITLDKLPPERPRRHWRRFYATLFQSFREEAVLTSSEIVHCRARSITALHLGDTHVALTGAK